MSETNYIIYAHINKINNKVYVGQTSLAPQIRWGNNGIGYKRQNFWNAIQEFGWDNFEHIILESNLTSEQADMQERYWIKYYNSLEPNGYNCDSGGGGISESTKERMSKAQQKMWDNISPEDKKERLRGLRQASKEDKTGEKNPMYGRSRSGKNAGNRRRVLCIETGQIFDTVTDASKWCNNGNISLKSHIAQQIQGKRKSCGKHPVTKEKLHWRYVDED